jgi:hypothetical protein
VHETKHDGYWLMVRKQRDRVLYAFDLLELEGEDFPPQPLHVRKAGSNSCSRRRRPASNKISRTGRVRRLPHGLGGDRLEAPRAWLKVKNPAAPGAAALADRRITDGCL